MNDTCKNCGAWEGLHHYETMQCPRNGMETPVGRKQEWQSTTFQRDDSDEIEKRIADAVAAEREANREPLEAAAQRLRSIAAYANTLPRRYAAGLSQLCAYDDIVAAAIRARSEATK